MTWIFQLSSSFSYIIEMLAACLVFTLPLKKRTHPVLGFLLGAVLSLGASAFTGSIIRDNPWQAVLVYLIQLTVVILPVGLSCDISVSDAIYGTLCAYAMQHFASSLYIFVGVWSGLYDFSKDGWVSSVSLLYYLLVYAAIYAAFYWLFARPLANQGAYQANFLQSSSLTILVVPIALVLSLIGKLTDGTRSGLLLHQVYAMLCSVFVLWVQVSQRRAVYWQRELAIQEQLWRSQKGSIRSPKHKLS